MWELLSQATLWQPQTAANSRGVCVSEPAAAPGLTQVRLPARPAQGTQRHLVPCRAAQEPLRPPPSCPLRPGQVRRRPGPPVRTFAAALEQAAEADGGGAQQLVPQRVADPHLQLQVALSCDIPAETREGGCHRGLIPAPCLGSRQCQRARSRGRWARTWGNGRPPSHCPPSLAVSGSDVMQGTKLCDTQVSPASGTAGHTGPAPQQGSYGLTG